jgi:hypothetical protein
LVVTLLVSNGMWLRESGAIDEIQEPRNAQMASIHMQRMETKALYGAAP